MFELMVEDPIYKRGRQSVMMCFATASRGRGFQVVRTYENLGHESLHWEFKVELGPILTFTPKPRGCVWRS